MSRKSKIQNVSKLINTIDKLMATQENMMKYINELEDYIAILEITIDREDEDPFGFSEEVLEELKNSETLKQTLKDDLTDEQKNRLDEIKNKKQNLHSLDDLLKIIEQKDD